MTTTEDNQALYPMRVVTRLTGLTADTIRVWERRYGAVVPKRTQGNTRMFTPFDVRRLTLMKEATARGYRIRTIANLSIAEIESLIAKKKERFDSGSSDADRMTSSDPYEELRHEYLDAVERFDVRKAEDIMIRSSLLLGCNDFAFHMAIPVLQEAGRRWACDQYTVAHEHLISAHLRSILARSTATSQVQPGSPRIVVTTPENHLHEFGVLVGSLIAVSRGFEPIYLGPNLPEDDTLLAVEKSNASLLILGVVRQTDETETARLAATLNRLGHKVTTWLGLPKDHPVLEQITEVRCFHSFEDLDIALTDRSTRGKP